MQHKRNRIAAAIYSNEKTWLAGLLSITALVVTGVDVRNDLEPDPLKGSAFPDIRPNIIIILADDAGYGDLGGYYGGKANTPNLSLLAKQGMVFTDFHSNGPMCSPTRAALMTGRYQQRLGIERALPTDWDSRGIGSDENANEVTMAQYLSESGYATGIFGKWHLGKHISANPVYHGFDEFRGLTCGCSDYFTKLDRNGYEDWWHNDQLFFEKGYISELITDHAIRFIEKNKDRPFFLYIPHLSVHFPWQAPEDGGLETRRHGEDFSGNYPGPQSKLGPHPPEKVPSVLIRMIEDLDERVGDIMNSLYHHGLDRNTLVVFTSDNGGYLNYHGKTWPLVGSNGSLRGQKTEVYEGGHRVPAIAWWPDQISSGTVCNQTIMSFDLLPTFIELIENISGKAIDVRNVLDGKSILTVLLNNGILPERTLFWRMDDQKAVRQGRFKMVIPGHHRNAELYDLDADIGESNDLAAQYPDIVREMQSDLRNWEESW